VIALDTNILVTAHRRGTAHHEQALALLQALSEGPAPYALFWPSLYEFLRVVTHHRVFDPPSTTAEALEAIAAKSPGILLPGHGHPATNVAAVNELLLTTAAYLRSIHDQVVERMNAGQWLEQILDEVEPPAELAAKPWLQPVYGHPQFIIHGVWRQYGGWWDGNPANFFPAQTQAQAEEIVRVAGADALLNRAQQLAESGDLPLACHLVDWVRRAEPDNAKAWQLWADLFERRASGERNMMARNTFRVAVREAETHLKGPSGEEGVS